jgi:hypothetical protein
METKICIKCREPKPATLEFFHNYPRNTDGMRGECKTCVKLQKKAWEAANPEKVKAAKRRRNAANPQSNRNRAKQWRIDNPEKYKANMQRWYQENREEVLAEIKADRKTNPEKYRAYELKEHFGITLELFNKILGQQGDGCACCGSTKPDGPHKQFVVDHDRACCSGKKSCGKCVRALLCSGCNLLLGKVKDDVSRLLALVAYLQRFPKNWFLTKPFSSGSIENEEN